MIQKKIKNQSNLQTPKSPRNKTKNRLRNQQRKKKIKL